MTPFKVLLIVLGTLSFFLGIIGIVVPGLPTTPFILLAAGLYIKSSDKLYQKLISNRFLGSYIKEFHAKKGMNKKTKISAISTMWFMILISCFFFIELLVIKVIVLLLGIIGTLVMGFVVPTVNSPSGNSKN